MAKDNAVQNQKVFVSLEKVLEFQRQYLDTMAECKRLAANSTHCGSYAETRRAFERVIELFNLPIRKVV